MTNNNKEKTVISVSSVSEYIAAIEKINSDNPEEVYQNRELLFRGQSSTEYKLVPSLGRYKNGEGDLFFAERNMIETAKSKMPHVFTKDLEPIELLALLQHYGVPTRLLDLTENALVALFFACEKVKDKTGEVVVFGNGISDVVDYPVANAIADSYRFSRGSFCSLEFFYRDVIQQPYFLEQKSMVQYLHETDAEGAKWIAHCCDKPFFVRASVRLARQQLQGGRYILFPNAIEKVSEDDPGAFFSRIDPMSKNHESILGRITIPKEVKTSILKELKTLGIDRGKLFADSVDIVCEEIKNDFMIGY